ncbi:MAG: hypothetical protein A2Z14_08155 [Chloroflexi bacterium RBG_16_48_8]|nr:MAG: hypothetical protein A2Z14_08155 [Chloroflexi bacterium RBG_16_48_8]
MQTAVTHTRKRTLSSEPILLQDRKAALGAAFRWFPVVLSFLLSSLSISFLLKPQPASATSTFMQNPSMVEPLKTDTIFNHSFDFQPVHLSTIFTKEVLFWEKEIHKWADAFHLDANLVAVVMQIESCGHPDIESGSGAKGLFQVMPFHFSSDENPFDPETNASRGLSYLSKGLRIASYDPVLALAGYNGGHGVISLDPTYWSDETRRYVYWGSGILADISAGVSQSSRLQEWMRAGGESLCRLSAAALGL